jgi:hypothetical protein
MFFSSRLHRGIGAMAFLAVGLWHKVDIGEAWSMNDMPIKTSKILVKSSRSLLECFRSKVAPS